MPFLPIREDTAPYIVFDGESTKAVYDHARVYVELLRSHFVRVTQRGVQFGIAEGLRPVFSVDNALTESIACYRRPHALCETTDGVLVLPTGLVDFPGAPAPSRYLQSFDGHSPCSSRATGRTFNDTDTRYEISLCDVIDGRLDLIYDATSDTLHWRADQMTFYEYLPLALLAVYLMSCVSVNIIKFVHREPYAVDKYTLTAAAAVLVYSCAASAFGSLRFIATTSDLYLFALLLVFVAAEILTQLRPLAGLHGGYVGGISVNIACLLLLTLPIHYSFDNPYTPVLTVIFGVRSWTRCVSVLARPSLALFALSTIDLLVLAALLQVGIGHAAYDAHEAAAEQARLGVTAVVFGQLVHLHQQRDASDTSKNGEGKESGDGNSTQTSKTASDL